MSAPDGPESTSPIPQNDIISAMAEDLGKIVPIGTGPRTVAVRESPIRDEIAARWLLAQDRENTTAAYRRDIKQFFAWCDEFGIPATMATSHHLRGYRRFLEDGSAGRAYEPATVHRKLTVVSSYFKFATQEFDHIVSVNPLVNVKRPKITNETTTVGLDLDELQRLLVVADRAGLWQAAFVRMLFYSGARVSEICNARTSDMRTERGHRTLWVTRKGGKRFRLTVSAPAAEALDRYLAGRAGPLFLDRRARPLTRAQATYHLNKLVREAGISKKITPHSMRHTAATLALDDGADIREVQRMLGHEKIETTLRYDRSRLDVDRSPTHALARAVEGVS